MKIQLSLLAMLAFVCALSTPALSQSAPTYINVQASSCIRDASGALVQRGTISFTPTTSFTLGNGAGQALGESISRSVSTGSMTGTLQLANPAITSPESIGYTIVVTDLNSYYTKTYPNVPITADESGNWNYCAWDSAPYNPSVPVTVVTGPVGATPNLQIGSVTTLGAGQPATASISGTTENPLLNLGIPQGVTGSGSGGSNLTWLGVWTANTVYVPDDVVSYDGSSYVATSSFTSGSSWNPANWTLVAQAGATGTTGATGLQGETGATGATGATGSAGTAATITVNSVTTLAPGSSATVTNIGNANAALLNFGIPAGQGFNFRGAWSASTTYAPYDVVTYGGQTYECSTGFTSTSSFNAANWNLWAQQGAQGATGATGATGSSATMIYPGAGIAVSTGTGWGTSLTAPTGTIVGTIDTQTLTNKTLDGVTPATMAFVDATSSIQTQLNAKSPTAGSTSIVTVGTIATGTWQGTPIGASYVATLNQNTTGNAATATALAATPTLCTGGQAATGILANGNATGCFGIADTTVTTGTTAVSSYTCNAASTATLTGLTTSMTVDFTPSTDVYGSSVAGWVPSSTGQLYIQAWPSASNTLSYRVCNPTGASITPGSVTWNVSAR